MSASDLFLERQALRARVVAALLGVIENVSGKDGKQVPVAVDQVGGITRTYATVADRLEAVRLLYEIGAL